MKKIDNAIKENDLVRDPGHSIVTYYLDLIFDRIFYYSDNELNHLKGKKYIYTMIDYGDLFTTSSIFKHINKKTMNEFRKGDTFFIYDATNEGFSPEGWFPIFDVLYQDCIRYKIDPKKILYFTGNHQDPINIKKFSKKYNMPEINVLAINIFETSIGNKDHISNGKTPIKGLKTAKKMCNKKFKGKLFSSLSRLNRPLRSLNQVLLHQAGLYNDALISHDTLTHDELINVKEFAREASVSSYEVDDWAAHLPYIVDYTDFEENWAVEFKYEHIHHQTIFQIVNETHAHNFENTSLFYSEKTFKPIFEFQPFVIWGQPGANHKLKDFGYEIYDDWFDLSFDWEEDDITRCQMLVESVQDTCDKLKAMSREEKIAWRFKNQEKLIHNYKILTSSPHTIYNLYEFFKNLEA